MRLATYYLTCADEVEATKIINALLENKHCACIKQSNVKSSFFWDGEIQNDTEVLLIIESTEEKFEDIDTTIKKLHSYDQYVLTCIPVSKTNSGVIEWMEESLQ